MGVIRSVGLSLVFTISCLIVATFVAALDESFNSELNNADSLKLRRQAIVDFVNNNEKSTWKAALNPRVEHLKRRGCNRSRNISEAEGNGKKEELHDQPQRRTIALEDLPAEFDAREAWPHCASIKEILDRQDCASDWAFATTAALSDRICVQSSGARQPRLAPNDLLACCDFCAPKGDPCDDGDPFMANLYLTLNGAVTEDCSPYYLSDRCQQSCYPDVDLPSCSRTCSNGKSWEGDKYYASLPYYVSPSAGWIKQDLYLNGPLSLTFLLFKHFSSYKSGVYKHLTGKSFGHYHTAKENGVEYWLMANSWGTDFGEAGFFKFLLGVNECDIESRASAALPSLPEALREAS